MYTAVVLTAESRDELLAQHLRNPTGWHVKGHHMTVSMGPAASSPAAHLVGQTVELTVLRHGVLEGEVQAVEVACSVPSKNAIKHVTLSHSPTTKPVMANSIIDWVDVRPQTLYGVVQEVA